jgi:hypothetical protein
MERDRKFELIQRSLGLRHKLKVHESMKQPDTHEDLAVMLMAKWELEDELRAIEEILADTRIDNVRKKRGVIEKEGPKAAKSGQDDGGARSGKKSRK